MSKASPVSQPLLAHSVSLRGARPCPELGVKPTCRLNARTSQFDPERTFLSAFARPDEPSEINLAGRNNAGSWSRFDDQLVALYPIMTPLLCPIPLLVP